MVNQYEDWVRPSFLPPTEWTPEEEWDRITGRQAPYWEARAPMQQLGQRLSARYLLGTPDYLRQQAGAPSFEDYVGGFIGEATNPWEAQSYSDLLTRARSAAEATRMDPGKYMATGGPAGGFVPDTDPWREAAWYAGMFNPAGGLGARAAAANQLDIATLLAQQRQVPLTGAPTAYGGQMGRAIAAAMQNMQRYQQDIGQPQGSFLDWYLSRIPEATT